MRSTAASVRRFVPFALTPLLAACASVAAPPVPVTVGIVAINDFHGDLEAPRQSAMVPDGQGGTVALPAGGAAWLASAAVGCVAGAAVRLAEPAQPLIAAWLVAQRTNSRLACWLSMQYLLAGPRPAGRPATNSVGSVSNGVAGATAR